MNRAPAIPLHPTLAHAALGRALHAALAKDEILRNAAALRELYAIMWGVFLKLHATEYNATCCEFGNFAILLREELDRLEGRAS